MRYTSALPTSRVDAGTSRLRPAIGGAGFALGVLFFMNLLNYIDRYVFSSVYESIRTDLNLRDARMGELGGAFMIVYTLVSPLMGYLGDRFDRRRLLAFGVGLWSVATIGTAFAKSYQEMFIWRSVLGIGEASYGVIAPALIADLFEPKRRGRMIGFFYLALPVGAAFGFALGGLISKAINWRAAFLIVGFPGLIAAALGLRILDPGRGHSEAGGGTPSRPRLRDYLNFFRNRTFLCNTFGMAGVTFTTGAVAHFGSAFYQRVHGMTEARANIRLGALLALGGLVGIALGSWCADLLSKRTKRAYLVWSTFAVGLALPIGLLGLITRSEVQSLALLFGCCVLLSSVLGPANTVTANVVPASERATGYALSIFLLHLFGDISSLMMVGHFSDALGSATAVHSPLGAFLANLGALPIAGRNLRGGLLLVAPALAISVVCFAVGSIFLPRDQNRASRSNPAGDDDNLELLVRH